VKNHSGMGALALVSLLASPAAFAHEGHIHTLRGTVAGFHADTHTLEITTTAGKKETVAVAETTKYVRGTATTTSANLKPGIRVVVSYKEEGGTKTAIEVKIGATTGNKTPATGAGPPPPKPSSSPRS
jgi:hypothetical protein